MTTKKTITIRAVLGILDVEKFIGDESSVVNNIISFNASNTDSQAISWCSEKNMHLVKNIQQGVIVVPAKLDEKNLKKNCHYIFVEKPRMAFRNILHEFFTSPPPPFDISPTAFIDGSVNLSSNVSIGHNVVIEANCQIGEGVRISSNTHIKENSIIKDNAQIGSNCTIGAVGFGYEKDDSGEYVFIPHIGNVVICENVEIGNNTCIDKAVLGSTYIGKNVKIDNLVHIAHGVQIGENSLIIANSMIAGSCVIGNDVWVAPSASILNKVSLGDDTIIGLGAVVLKDTPEKSIIIGNPGKQLER